ncbi:hypothetical protein [Corallococcus carmarthensis]|uniref:hypothetical protein n=1 Tax=Corallococcus carmarthensis TaxID=2316728 RepID=UPI00148E1CAE|nr:hypothetical protein [Corallococcus carmarthensis]NOK16519.1 hypothetical protein [Corallococcus carmarthensis]
MKTLKGMLKGGVLGIPYALAATILVTRMFYSSLGWTSFFEMALFVAAYAAPAGAAVGGAIVLTGAFRQGSLWRAQLVMVAVYVVVGFVGLKTTELGALASIAYLSPAFLPLGLLATWTAARWIRRQLGGPSATSLDQAPSPFQVR